MKNNTLAYSMLAMIAIAVLATTAGCDRSQQAPRAGAELETQENGFVAGYPTDEKAQELFDEFDYQAAVQAYVWATPMLNSLGLSEAMQRDVGMEPGELATAIHSQRQLPHQTVMTANDEVVYTWSQLINTAETGPIVVEIPAGGLGFAVDLFQRPLEDFGSLGPDRGGGGAFLFLPVDYDGAVPEGYFPVRLEYSDVFWFVYRTFPNNPGMSLESAVELGRQVKAWPLEGPGTGEPGRSILIGDGPFDQDWPKDAEAFEWIARGIDMDRPAAMSLSTLGNLRRLGIEKGKPFAPDERAQAILERAAKTGWDIVRAIAFNNRFDGARVYDDRQWEKIAHYTSPWFLTESYEEVEERASWYQLVGNTSKVVPASPGTGVFYSVTYKDADGSMLDGSGTYRLTMPADVPVTQFWQVPVYSNKTRSLINAEQKRPTRSSTDDLLVNDDGSVDVFFGPEAPQGREQNWIQTIPGEGWFVLLRLYGPLEPILEKTWKPNDIERVN